MENGVSLFLPHRYSDELIGVYDSNTEKRKKMDILSTIRHIARSAGLSVGLMASAAFAQSQSWSIVVTPAASVAVTCTKPDAAKAQTCDVTSTAPVGTVVGTFTITGGSLLSFVDSSGQFSTTGSASPYSIVTTKTPLTLGTFPVTINPQ